MKHDILPDYNEVGLALKKNNLKLPPSQVHGLICGMLCGDIKSAPKWETLFNGGHVSPEAHEVLQALYELSRKQLSAFLFEFQLLLPNDDNALAERAESLSVWCQGFLTGLKFVQVPIVDRKPNEMTEAIDDLIAIAKMNYDDVTANEEDENAYTELVEYVRMAAILIYQQCHELEDESRPAGKKLKHLH